MVWQKEFIRLNSVRKRNQADIDIHVRKNTAAEAGACGQMFQEFEDYENKLDTDFTEFKKATTEPVWNLR